LREIDVTSIVAMQRRLFGVDARRAGPVSDAVMWQVLRELRRASALNRFDLFLVGSRLEEGHDASDVDLVLSPRPGSAFSDPQVERALWHCREYGLHAARPACLIDISFRRSGPHFHAAPLPPGAVLQTVKLLSPSLARLVRDGKLPRHRRFGRYSIEYWRTAGEASYYGKLPEQLFGGAPSPYLRPALKVTARSEG
jgi:hypothetical protein